jgi:hypothetical protein
VRHLARIKLKTVGNILIGFYQNQTYTDDKDHIVPIAQPSLVWRRIIHDEAVLTP